MVALLATGVALLAVLVMVGGWVLYGLLRQNGRMLLRIDALEAALDHGAERQAGRVFADRSLAKSRINRAGLATRTAASWPNARSRCPWRCRHIGRSLGCTRSSSRPSRI